jgi:hypothetical protein
MVWRSRPSNMPFRRERKSLENWWHYFSPQAMRVMEWGHYFGTPSLLAHTLTRRWIIAPWHWNLYFTEQLVRKYTHAQQDPQGTFTFYVARRA